VGEALVGNDGVDQLVNFNKALIVNSPKDNVREIDAIILSKFDTVDEKGILYQYCSRCGFVTYISNRKANPVCGSGIEVYSLKETEREYSSTRIIVMI
jgi:uncharacterized OB-fold protein